MGSFKPLAGSPTSWWGNIKSPVGTGQAYVSVSMSTDAPDSQLKTPLGQN